MRPALVVLATAVFVQLAVAIGLAVAFFAADGADAQTVRDYELEIVPADIDYGGGNVWHAWTFKLADAPAGTVPGPTLTVTVGEKLRVHVTNKLDLTHSFHTHLTGYDQVFDGSQANIISGAESGAMIPPGGEFTYEFEPKEAGIYYYHCHSADGGLMISQHIHQGLYGAIIVEGRNDPPVRDEVIFMGEMGHETEGDAVPPYIMNGMGLPGGEHALEGAYVAGGFDAVAAQLNKTVPAIEAEVGEQLRVHVINIGDQIHSFHAHNVDHISEQALDGRMWPANVLPLIPGAADTLRLTFTNTGIWLFHCHVVNHADAGMIGVFIVREPGAPNALPEAQRTPVRQGGASEAPPTRASPTPTQANAAGPSGSLQVQLREWEITGEGGGALPQVVAGDIEVEARNSGASPHELAIIKTGTDPADLPVDGLQVDEDAAGELIGRIAAFPGGSTERATFTLAAGNYVLLCNVPTHYDLGMHARLVVQ